MKWGKDVDILSISYFVTAAENMSFSAAARILYVSQPTISKSIAKLETELGLSLFNRHGKTVKLTAAGQLLYYDFKTLLQIVDEIKLHAKDVGNAVSGIVSVSVPKNMDLSRLIPGFLNKFTNDNPGIRVVLRYEPRNIKLKNFIESNDDCAFFLSIDAEYLQNEMSIKRIDLPKSPHRLIYSPSLFPADFTPTPESFKDKKLLSYRSDVDHISIYEKEDAVLESIGLDTNSRTFIDSVDALLYLVSEGLGVSLVGPSLRLESSDKIHWVPVLNEKSMVSLCLCYKTSNENSASKTFMNALEAWCENNKTAEI